MKIDLKNIGILKNASVKIDGLTVVAGENDTGKSTLSKAVSYGLMTMKKVNLNEELIGFPATKIFDFLSPTKIFDVDIRRGINVDYLEKSSISINIEGISINPKLNIFSGVGGVSCEDMQNQVRKLKGQIPDVVYVETPAIWSFLETFRSIAQINQQMNIDIKHPYLMNDLSIKLFNTSTREKKSDLSDRAKEIMNGEFKKDDTGKFYFERNGIRMELINIATGLKYFGILQILSENGWLAEGNVVVLDEPEVHMHPKWQLQLAEIIVSLVKQGVKIIVNSHSPYMIEALKRYSDKEGLGDKSNFYLAKDGVIEDNNSLSQIFELLSEPFDVFDKMDSEILKDE